MPQLAGDPQGEVAAHHMIDHQVVRLVVYLVLHSPEAHLGEDIDPEGRLEGTEVVLGGRPT